MSVDKVTNAEKEDLLADVPLEELVLLGRDVLEKYGGHKHSRDEGLATDRNLPGGPVVVDLKKEAVA